MNENGPKNIIVPRPAETHGSTRLAKMEAAYFEIETAEALGKTVTELLQLTPDQIQAEADRSNIQFVMFVPETVKSPFPRKTSGLTERLARKPIGRHVGITGIVRSRLSKQKKLSNSQ